MAHRSIWVKRKVNCRVSSSGDGYNAAMPTSVWAVLLSAVSIAVPVWAAGDAPTLDVRVVPAGGVRARATILFAVPPTAVEQVLTDYRRWPELFDVRMTVASVTEEEGSAIVALRIDHSLLPGERRLVCASRSMPGGELVTELRTGDFKQYRRVWRLIPADGGRRTKAQFELMVQVDTIVPDWMVAFALRQELETHFRLVSEKALAAAATRGK